MLISNLFFRVASIHRIVFMLSMGICLVYAANAWGFEHGVNKSAIRIGGVMDLEGDSRGLGQGMKIGIEAAIKGERIKGRKIEFVVLNDFYNPSHTIAQTEKLIGKGIFLMIGNVGTPTAKVSLPILAQNRVPAVGFFTGAGILRPGVGDIVNVRASYVQETAKVIDTAIMAGMSPKSVCAYVQNDAYGMAGVAGIKKALAKQPGMFESVKLFDQIIAMKGEDPMRNNIGPVGVYTRNTLSSRDGYESLKNWEALSGNRCQLVVTVGTYRAIAGFAGYSRYKGEKWYVSAVSFTGAENFKSALEEFKATDRIIMTQVVPPLNSDLPIVKQARKALGKEKFGYVSLEGYIVGRLFVETMKRIKGEITRQKFLQALYGQSFKLGGMKMNYSTDNQGSDLVLLTFLDGSRYRNMRSSDWKL